MWLDSRRWAGVETGRRSRFEASQFEAQLAEAVGRVLGGGFAGPPTREGAVADVDAAFQEGAGGEDDGFPEEHGVGPGANALHGAVFDQEFLERALLEVEVGSVLNDFLHPELVGLFVGLRPRGLYGGPFAAVQHAKLDAGFVDVAGHFAAQGVDLADHMPLGDAADGRIARHLRHGVQVHREQERARAHPRGRQSGLGARVASADDEYVVGCWVDPHREEEDRTQNSGFRRRFHLRLPTGRRRRRGRRRPRWPAPGAG